MINVQIKYNDSQEVIEFIKSIDGTKWAILSRSREFENRNTGERKVHFNFISREEFEVLKSYDNKRILREVKVV